MRSATNSGGGCYPGLQRRHTGSVEGGQLSCDQSGSFKAILSGWDRVNRRPLHRLYVGYLGHLTLSRKG